VHLGRLDDTGWHSHFGNICNLAVLPSFRKYLRGSQIDHCKLFYFSEGRALLGFVCMYMEQVKNKSPNRARLLCFNPKSVALLTSWGSLCPRSVAHVAVGLLLPLVCPRPPGVTDVHVWPPTMSCGHLHLRSAAHVMGSPTTAFGSTHRRGSPMLVFGNPHRRGVTYARVRLATWWKDSSPGRGAVFVVVAPYSL